MLSYDNVLTTDEPNKENICVSVLVSEERVMKMTTGLLPPGCRFLPTEKELIVFYLQKKVNGEILPSGVVAQCDIYGKKNPWEIFDKGLKKNFYVFTTLQMEKKNGESRIERKAGLGTWTEGQINPVKEPETKQILGFKKDFVFEDDAATGDNNGHWIMTEYSLPDPDGRSIRTTGHVLCRIRNTRAKYSDGEFDDEELNVLLSNLINSDEVNGSAAVLSSSGHDIMNTTILPPPPKALAF